MYLVKENIFFKKEKEKEEAILLLWLYTGTYISAFVFFRFFAEPTKVQQLLF